MRRQQAVLSCPGKLLLCGEYAVLHGAPAVVAAVDRRAFAFFLRRAPAAYSPVLAAVREQVLRFGEQAQGPNWSLPPVSIDTASFQRRGRKLGLGSSAAAAVAACGAWMFSQGVDVQEGLGSIVELSHAGHRTAQGGRGSGVDIAASAHGGVLRFRPGEPVVSLPLPRLEVAAVDTGQSASTAELLAAVEAYRAREPRGHAEHLRALSQTAVDFDAALVSQDTASLLRLADEYGLRMASLGEASGTPIVTETLSHVARLARAVGGAAKPSGAGGGDLAVAFFETRDALERFSRECEAVGLAPVRLRLGAAGLRLEPAAHRQSATGSVR